MLLYYDAMLHDTHLADLAGMRVLRSIPLGMKVPGVPGRIVAVQVEVVNVGCCFEAVSSTLNICRGKVRGKTYCPALRLCEVGQRYTATQIW